MGENFKQFFLFLAIGFPSGRKARLRRAFLLLFVFFFYSSLLPAAFGGVPPLLNFQGRIVIGGVSYDGAGQFQFALVDGAGTNTFWSNDGTGAGGGEPSAAISMTLTNGLYAVVLGDTTVGGMSQPIDPGTFTNGDVRLRVWFNDGAHGFEQLSPDQRIVAAGYSLVAQTANNFSGPISSAQLPGNLATTNYVNAVTNGFVTAAITNGLATVSYVNTLTNFSAAVTWGTTASQTANSNPAKIFFFVTNGQPVFGILSTGN
jgi:hypothetical protein